MSALLTLLLTNAATAGVLALLAWGASRALRRQALLHGLWLLAIVKLVTPPLLPLHVLPAGTLLRPSPPAVVVMPIALPLHRNATAAAAVRSPGVSEGPASPEPQLPPRPLAAGRAEPAPAVFAGRGDGLPQAVRSLDLAGVFAALIAISALAILAVTAGRFLRFQRLLARAHPAAGPLARRAEALSRRLGLRRMPSIRLVHEALPPMLWPAASGPTLVLPAGLLAQLTDEELDALLAHELAHVRRGDHWVRLVEVAATALFWWYPVTWWSRRALRRAEERCCDEWVLRLLPSSAEAYANGLLKSLTFVAENPASLPVAASGAGPVHDLEARLKEILMTRPLPQLSRPLRLALAAAAVIGLAVFPTRAQTGTSPGDKATPAVAEVPATAATSAVVARPPRASRPVVAAARRGAAAVVVGAPRAPVGGVPVGIVGGVPGGVIGGVPGGIVGRVTGGLGSGWSVRALLAGRGPAALLGGDDDPALEAERRALEDQRRQLQAQELEIERRSVELEARSEQARLKAEADRLRAEGLTSELARVEKQGQLSARRLALRTRQLQLEAEHSKLEAELERTERADEERVAALEKAGHDEQAEKLQQELERSRETRERAEQELEQKQQALEAEMEQAEQEEQALESEQRVEELRLSSGELRQTLSERLDALREALPEAGAQKPELEAEIRKIQSAIDALGSSPPKSPSPKAPRAQP